MAPAVQPPLIAGLINAVLVFCALVVAGALSVLSSAAAHLAGWAVATGLLAVAAALLGGLAALFAMLHALNLSRRVEKASNPVTAAEQISIDSARRMAATYSEVSFWLCGAATLAVGALLFGFVTATPASPPGSEVRLVLRTAQGVVELNGDLRRVRIADPTGGCVLYLEGDVSRTAQPRPC